jgi:hypothetical protein
MSTQTFWRPGDGRSLRSDRVPVDLRLPGRMIPLNPLTIADTRAEWMPLAYLDGALQQLNELLKWHVPEYPEDLTLTFGHYPEVAGLAFGGQQRELLVPGLYVITDSGPHNRVLYLGSSVDATARLRLIDHLYGKARLVRAQNAYRCQLQEWSVRGYPAPDEGDRQLRRLLWQGNRWSGKRGMTHAQALACDLVSQGAFQVAMLSVPRMFSPVARCLERFATEYVLAVLDRYPPLNDARVLPDWTGCGSSLDLQRALELFWAMDAAARELGR